MNLHHRVPFETPDEVAELRAERLRLRVAVADLRRECDDLRVELDHERRQVAHLEKLMSRRWWQR